MRVDIAVAAPGQGERIEFLILRELLDSAGRSRAVALGSDSWVIHDGGGTATETGGTDAGFGLSGTGVLGLQNLVASESGGDHEGRRRGDSDDWAGAGPVSQRPGGANTAT